MIIQIFPDLYSEWIRHIQKRLQEAKEINLIPNDFVLDLSAAISFAPKLDYLPRVSDSINEILNVEIHQGWNYRRNEIRSAAEWISKEVRNSFLVLEGGYSQDGDKSIENLPYQKNGDGVLFTISSNASIEEIDFLLRRSVSRRILGKVGDFFICDAFDCDSIVITSRATE